MAALAWCQKFFQGNQIMNSTYFNSYFNLQDVRDAIDGELETCRLLAEILIAVYRRRHTIFIQTLEELDTRTLDIAIAIITYRQAFGWSDRTFFELATFAAECHNLDF